MARHQYFAWDAAGDKRTSGCTGKLNFLEALPFGAAVWEEREEYEGGAMADGSNGSGGGIGLMGVLFVVFLVLKLCNVIDWSWWWVTAPLWIPAALALVVFLICGLFMLAAGLLSRSHGR